MHVRPAGLSVYWIEDEFDRLQWTVNRFNRAGTEVIQLFSAAEVLRNLKRIKESPGPIILDLFLPRGVHPDVPMGLKGCEIGMWVLDELQRQLDERWPIFILSGNLEVDAIKRLHTEYRLRPERVFSKPLLDDAHKFVEMVLEAGRKDS
jgi:hypothetical protein